MEISTPEGYHTPKPARRTMLLVTFAFVAGFTVILLANIQWKRPATEPSPQATTTSIGYVSQIMDGSSSTTGAYPVVSVKMLERYENHVGDLYNTLINQATFLGIDIAGKVNPDLIKNFCQGARDCNEVKILQDGKEVTTMTWDQFRQRLLAQHTEAELAEGAADAFNRCASITFTSTVNTGDGEPCSTDLFCYRYVPANAKCFEQPAATSTTP